jgi:hypothetical protein
VSFLVVVLLRAAPAALLMRRPQDCQSIFV